MATAKRIHLVVPELLSRLMLDMALYDPSDHRLHALQILLSRATLSQRRHALFDQELFSLLGVKKVVQQDLPLAACAARAELNRDSGAYLLLEPVHLRADQATLRLFDYRLLNLEVGEGDALFSACQSFFADQGWQLERGEEYWYLQFSQYTAITTTPLHEVMGQSIDPVLPAGTDAMYWHRLMNELQMMLHTHPVNVERERNHRPMANSLWFWGGGSLPMIENSLFSRIYGGAAEVRGLALAANVPHAPLPDAMSGIDLQQLPVGDHLLIMDGLMRHAAYQDVEDWFDTLVQLCVDWFKPLLEVLRGGQVDEVLIYPVNGKCYRVGRWQLYCFWRRVKTLSGD